MKSGSSYIHGTDPEERDRLSRMNAVLNAACLRELALRGGERILEVGSGLGHFALEMARAVGPRGSVLGIERDEIQLAESRANLATDDAGSRCEVRRGDALALPLEESEWGAFDVAHARFLLEHVPSPERVVEGMAGAVRLGGRVVLEDDDHDVLRLWPEPQGVREIWEAYVETYRRRGHDPHVGRRLVSLLDGAGLAPRRCTWVFFGASAGDEPRFSLLARNLIEILHGARAAVLEATSIDAARYDAAMQALLAWSRGRAPALWYAIAWAEGERTR